MNPHPIHYVDRPRTVLPPTAFIQMSKFFKTLVLTATATGVAALILYQLDLESVREEVSDADSEFPGMNPDDMKEEDVAMLLNELASHL